MTWDRIALRGAIAGLALALGSAAIADTIVVRASGPSAKNYPPGRKLAESGALALQPGDVVTLLDAKGTRTLRGPGNFNVAAANAAPAGGVALAALLDTKRVRRARTGAVRGGVGQPGTPRRPNLWLADVATPGALCVADPATLKLWRADTTRAATVQIAGGGAQATASFAAGEAIAAWPAALPVRDGASYRVSADGHPAEIRVALIDAGTAGMDTIASTLIAHGCTAQLDLLVDAAAPADKAAKD